MYVCVCVWVCYLDLDAAVRKLFFFLFYSNETNQNQHSLLQHLCLVLFHVTAAQFLLPRTNPSVVAKILHTD